MNQEIMVSALFPSDLEKAIRVAAACLGVSRSEFVRRATEFYLENVEPPSPTNTKIIKTFFQDKERSNNRGPEFSTPPVDVPQFDFKLGG